MPILYVNGKRRGLRVKGRARVGGLHRRGRRNPPKGARKGKNGRWVSAKSIAALKRYNRQRRERRGFKHAGANYVGFTKRTVAAMEAARKKRRAKARRSTHMAKGSRKRSRAMKAYWRKRKASGKRGALGRTHRKKRRATKKRRTRARRSHRAKRTRRSRRTRRMRARRTVRMSTRAYRRRARKAAAIMAADAVTLRANPGRRRRRRRRRTGAHRRRRSHRRRYRRNPTRRRRSRRRSYRRYSRRYRRNPSMGDLMSLAKQALPVLGAFYGSRVAVGMIGPMLPGVSALGSLMGPALSVGAIFLGDWLGKKFLPSSRASINMGTTAQAIDSVIRAFAPASVKSMIGMSDYVQMGDYVAVGAVPPLRENFTLSDYIAVGGDGVEQELGLEEELGVEEELGNVADGYMGGLPGGTRLLAPVPTQAFVTPVPARSFTKAIPPAGTSYDAASDLYGGIFGGRFGS